MKRIIGILALLLVSAGTAFAGENDAAQAAYCQFVTEQAKAQRDLLRTPLAVVGPIQPNTGTPPQLVFGVTNSLSDDKKAGLSMDVARKTCALYTAATEAQMHIYYALPSIEKDVLRHRLQLIQDTSDKLDNLILENMKLVDAQNLTRPALYALQGAKVRLDSTRTAALTGIASPYVPPLSDVPLRQLIADKLENEAATQTATARLAKQQTWDIKLSAGVHRQLANVPSNQSAYGAYGEFGLTYNLGRKAVNSHLDKSVAAYNDWKANQFDDVAHQAVILKRQITDTIAIQETQLKVLQDHDVEIEKNLRALDGVETNSAFAFRNELIADQLVLRVDIGDVQFRMELLKNFVANNF